MRLQGPAGVGAREFALVQTITFAIAMALTAKDRALQKNSMRPKCFR